MNESEPNAGTPEQASSLHEVDGLLALQRDCNTALTALYIAVDERVARDVNCKVRAYVAALEAKKQPIDELSDCAGEKP